MDNYLLQFWEMTSLRGLTAHTVNSYSTYIRAYLSYLSDRIMNACISQLRFFTIYVLHKPWDPSQLPFRKFDTYLPYVPSEKYCQVCL